MTLFGKISVFVSFLLLFACADDGVGDDSNKQLSGDRIFINPDTEYQTIDGFGASDAWRCKNVGKNWPLEKREAIADLLFSQDTDEDGNPEGIGLSLWRFYIGAGSEEQGAGSDLPNDWRRAECFLNPDGTYDWSKQQGQQWFLNAAKERGVNQFLAFSISAPVHYTNNGKAYASEDYNMNIKPGMMDDYADFMVNVVDHFNSEGIHFNYLSPVNETQYDWGSSGQEGTPASNDEIAQLTGYLSDKLSAKGLQTEIVLSEAANIKYLYSNEDKSGRANQVEDFFAPYSTNYVGDLENVKNTISAHSYWTTANLSDLVSVRQNANSKIKSIGNDLGFWQSEYSMLENTQDIGGGWDRDLGINTALYIARVIHADLYYANAQAWQWWTAISQYDYKDGLIYIDNGNNGIRSSNDPDSENLKYDGFVRDSKTLWALGNYSRFIRPGAKRIQSGFSIPKGDEQQMQSLMFSAYKDESTQQMIIVFVNYSSSSKDIVLGSLGTNFNIENNTFTTFTTSENSNLAKGTTNADQFSIPARSVVTLVGKYY
nr:glycoside hydrolase [uncultured Carboxylicivirga sp.]